MVRVLGISASLRNARFGVGNDSMIDELSAISDESALIAYLTAQTRIRLEDFAVAGRAEKIPFDQLYRRLRGLRGERGLSNSEAAMAAALWAALREGARARHLSLAHHFPMSGPPRDLGRLREALVEADAIILSGPVYFGDRGSLAQSLVEMIAADNDLAAVCAGKVYAGIAVGAKRNGGQETTLIYQLLDMVNLDFLAVGNSSHSTSQYGGTAVAGDVGTLHADLEGIETCIGTGRRAARVAELLRRGRQSNARLADRLKIQLWLLQDNREGAGKAMFDAWAQEVSAAVGDVDIKIIDVTTAHVARCIACDICPIDVGPRADYRCIIKSREDFFVQNHQTIVEADGVLLCAYSPANRDEAVSSYQKFIERTRYLRRDNYVFSDLLMAPFVISELSARQNLHLRMLTSAVRHHTVLHHPLIGMVHEGELLGRESMRQFGLSFVRRARELTVARYLQDDREEAIYHPKGYEISAEKAFQDQQSGRTAKVATSNALSHADAAEHRLSMASGE